MKSKLPTLSFALGVVVWIISIAGLFYFGKLYSVENPDPLSVFEPGAFESVLIVLMGAVGTGVGLLLGIIGLKDADKKKFSWAAITINGCYCIPISVLLLMQALQ